MIMIFMLKRNFFKNVSCEYFAEFPARSFDEGSKEATELAIFITSSFHR